MSACAIPIKAMQTFDSSGHQRDSARASFEALRDRICCELETLEREAPLDLFPWRPKTFALKQHTRVNGLGVGVGGFLQNGRLFEKACVHTSTTSGRFTPDIAATMPGAKQDPTYTSTSISLII